MLEKLENIELIKGLKYVNFLKENCVVIVLKFNEKLFCITFEEIDFMFKITKIENDWNYIAAFDAIVEIEKDYKPKYFSNLKSTFSTRLIKALKKELLTK